MYVPYFRNKKIKKEDELQESQPNDEGILAYVYGRNQKAEELEGLENMVLISIFFVNNEIILYVHMTLAT